MKIGHDYLFHIRLRSQEDVHKVEVTHEKPEKFVDKVCCLLGKAITVPFLVMPLIQLVTRR